MSHPVAETVFLFFLLLTLGSSGVVVFSANLVRSTFALLLTFFGVAGIYVFLGADFLAATQVLIYVGGILVLLLFAVMLTHRIRDARLSSESRHKGRSGLLAALVFVMLALMALATPWPQHPLPDAPTTAPLGEQFLSTYLLPFEAISVLLLVVIVGAAVIARREEPSAP